jgi:hypothetical protein
MDGEAAHFAREDTRERADVRLDAFGAVVSDGAARAAYGKMGA